MLESVLYKINFLFVDSYCVCVNFFIRSILVFCVIDKMDNYICI